MQENFFVQEGLHKIGFGEKEVAILKKINPESTLKLLQEIGTGTYNTSPAGPKLFSRPMPSAERRNPVKTHETSRPHSQSSSRSSRAKKCEAAKAVSARTAWDEDYETKVISHERLSRKGKVMGDMFEIVDEDIESKNAASSVKTALEHKTEHLRSLTHEERPFSHSEKSYKEVYGLDKGCSCTPIIKKILHRLQDQYSDDPHRLYRTLHTFSSGGKVLSRVRLKAGLQAAGLFVGEKDMSDLWKNVGAGNKNIPVSQFFHFVFGSPTYQPDDQKPRVFRPDQAYSKSFVKEKAVTRRFQVWLKSLGPSAEEKFLGADQQRTGDIPQEKFKDLLGSMGFQTSPQDYSTLLEHLKCSSDDGRINYQQLLRFAHGRQFNKLSQHQRKGQMLADKVAHILASQPQQCKPVTEQTLSKVHLDNHQCITLQKYLAESGVQLSLADSKFLYDFLTKSKHYELKTVNEMVHALQQMSNETEFMEKASFSDDVSHPPWCRRHNTWVSNGMSDCLTGQECLPAHFSGHLINTWASDGVSECFEGSCGSSKSSVNQNKLRSNNTWVSPGVSRCLESKTRCSVNLYDTQNLRQSNTWLSDKVGICLSDEKYFPTQVAQSMRCHKTWVSNAVGGCLQHGEEYFN